MAMNSFKKMIMMANQGSLLPSDYIECEYLESYTVNGYGQNFIATTVDVLDKEVEMTLQGNSNQKNSYTFPFGDNKDNYGSGLVCYKQYGYAITTSKLFNISITEKVTVNYKWYRKEVDGVLKDYASGKIGEKELEHQRSSSIQSTPQQSNFFNLKIFNSWDIISYGFVGKIFGCKVYDISDGKRVLIMNLIPVVRKSDDVAGFYDMVSRSFLTDVNLKPFFYKIKEF